MSEYFFRRYRNGERMAEDVRITQAATLEEASLAASRIAAQYRDGTVLVSEREVDLRAERDALRALLQEAREYTGYAAFYGDRIEADHAVDLCARIDAALNKLKD